MSLSPHQATRSSRAVASSMTILALAAGLAAMSASQADARGFPRGGGGLPAGRIGAMQRPALPAGRQPTAIANKPRLGDAAQRPAAAQNGNRAGGLRTAAATRASLATAIAAWLAMPLIPEPSEAATATPAWSTRAMSEAATSTPEMSSPATMSTLMSMEAGAPTPGRLCD